MVCKKVNISVLLFINVLGSQIYRKPFKHQKLGKNPSTKQALFDQLCSHWGIKCSTGDSWWDLALTDLQLDIDKLELATRKEKKN